MSLNALAAGRALLHKTSIATAFRPTTTSLRAARPALRTMASSGDGGAALDKTTPEETWRSMLSAEEYHVIRQKGTERPFGPDYERFYAEGEGDYVCRACGNPLYPSSAKFKAGCGWPALYAEYPGAVDRHTDSTMGMTRTEITCGNCGGHLGHVFQGEGFPTPTDERHCVNYVSVKFMPKA